MQRDLIYDLGMHDGTDTDFYLRKGFRVVAVEADPDLAKAGEQRFAQAIAQKRLRIVNKAIAARSGKIMLHRSSNTLWSTIDHSRAEMVARKGCENRDVEVEAITSGELIQEYGTPYYLKIDIEGMDLVALAGLADLRERPAYVSIESERRDMVACRQEIAALQAVGYHEFKIVAQHHVHLQREPDPPREGVSAGKPVHDSSGLFGEDLPGRWVSAAEAVESFRRPLLNHYLTGTDSVLRNRWIRAALKRVGFHAGWYDIHAKT